MDIADINKVANRKRMNVDAEKLREKVSRETAKIIKLKVAQDTAYWDLKEKLQQVEGNHERLQQNMVDVQMQHETISGQYQEELHHRPETLNKMNSTRSICDVLEDYCSRLKETLARCSSDQAALCAAYQRSGEIVQGIQQQNRQTESDTRAQIMGLERTVQLTTESRDHLVQLFTASQQQHEQLSQELRSRLRTAEEKRDELMNISCELTREVDKQKHTVELKEKSIESLQSELKRLMQEFHHQCGEMKKIITKQETDIKEASEANEELKKAVANQEQFTRSVCKQNEDLQEKVSSLEDEGVRVSEEMAALQGKLQDYVVTCDTLRRDVATLVGIKEALEKQIEVTQQEFEVTRKTLKGEVAALLETKQGLEKEVDDKKQNVAASKGIIDSLTSKLKRLELDNATVVAVLATTNEESADKSAVILTMTNSIQEMEAALQGLEKSLKEARATTEEKVKELAAIIEQKQADNTSQGVTINKLMNDVNADMKIKSELQGSIERLKKELEAERESGKQMERRFINQVEVLNGTLKDKEQDLSNQMTIILQTRAEKEKLQEKISGMQGAIDNIQKELTGRGVVAARAFVPAEQDDNAVSLTPRSSSKSQFPAKPRAAEFAVPRQKEISMFNIFSDSSVEGETPAVANRRFEAIRRSENLPRLAPPGGAPGAKRCRAVPQQERPHSPIIRLAPMRDEVNAKEKTFFKNKRPENKLKRFKKVNDEP